MATTQPKPARVARPREVTPRKRKGTLKPIGRADGLWDIVLKGGNGETIMRSVQGYTKKADANRAIADCKQIFAEDL